MTTGTPAPTGLALAFCERPVGVNPPLNYAAYRSAALRAPRRPLQVMPPGLTEVTGPVLGRERVIAADADLTTNPDQHPAPLDPNFTGAGRCMTDSRGRYRFDIHLQGDQETVFFDV